MNRVYDSAGPEGKVRGTPQQIIDKYLSLARDAQTSGDRVASENLLQHAEHYQRIVIQATQAQEQVRRESQDAATDTHGGQEQQPQVSGGEQRSQPDIQAAPAPSPQPEVQAAPVPDRQPEIGGMAMIDAAPAEAPLLVAGEEEVKPKPKAKANGDGRRRPRKQPAAAAPEPETAPEPDAAAEG